MAKAQVNRRGRAICAVEVAVESGSGELIAKALVTYKLSSGDGA